MVVMPCHVHQVLADEVTRLEEVRIVECAVGRHKVRMEQLDPLAVRSLRHLSGIATIATEEVKILREIEVDRPVIALHVEGRALAILEIVASEVKILALDRLPVIPDGL